MASATPYEDEIEAIQAKLQNLPPDLREAFLHTMARVYEEESWSLIDFLQQSRQEMTDMAHDMSEEQDQLRSASNMLAVHRSSSMQSTGSLGSAGAGGNSPRLARSPRSLNGSRNFDAEKRGHGHKSSEDEESLHEYNKEQSVDEYHEEAEEVMKNMKGVETAMQKERAIQSARLKMKKEAKMAKKKESENKATELIDRANQITEMQSKDKERQEQKVKEKLASKKQQQQQKKKNVAETSLDENWAVSYPADSAPSNGAQPISGSSGNSLSIPSSSDKEGKSHWQSPREKPEIGLAEVQN